MIFILNIYVCTQPRSPFQASLSFDVQNHLAQAWFRFDQPKLKQVRQLTCLSLLSLFASTVLYLNWRNHRQKEKWNDLKLLTFMTESLIRSSSATSSNSETGNSDSPKMMLPPQYKLTWPLTFKIKQEITIYVRWRT